MGTDATQTGSARRIVIVDDDAGTQRMLAEVVHAAGDTMTSWTRGAGAYEPTRRVQPDLVVLDV